MPTALESHHLVDKFFIVKGPSLHRERESVDVFLSSFVLQHLTLFSDTATARLPDVSSGTGEFTITFER